MVNLLLQWEHLPIGVIPAPEINIPTTQESLAMGADLFTANCSRCHGPKGQGTPRILLAETLILGVYTFLCG